MATVGQQLLAPETGSNRWTYIIPENKDSHTKTYHLLVYVDYGKSSEKFETVTFTQDAYEDELIETTYSPLIILKSMQNWRKSDHTLRKLAKCIYLRKNR